jgi:hypothetical protein
MRRLTLATIAALALGLSAFGCHGTDDRDDMPRSTGNAGYSGDNADGYEHADDEGFGGPLAPEDNEPREDSDWDDEGADD